MVNILNKSPRFFALDPEQEEEEEPPKCSGSKWNKYLSKKDKEEINYKYGNQEEN